MGNTILIIGSGGREHALAACFAKSPTVDMIYVAPGNPGMRDVATPVAIDSLDFDALTDFALSKSIDLVFVGPEAPLSKGIVDHMQAKGIKIFGPTLKAARLEASKSYAKEIMNRYGIPTAHHQTVYTLHEALNYLDDHPAPIVIKADGLMAGKGVTVAMDQKIAIQAVQDIYTDPTTVCPLVIEEYLEGEEFSLMAFVDQQRVFPLDIARDHKRAYDDDLGPNTGGMGAYSPVPFITQDLLDEAMEKIMKPTAQAMVDEGIPFTGILYGGLMATKTGIKTIEFNVRFGDPETEALLPRLLSPLDQVIFDVMNHNEVSLEFDPRFCLGVVLASNGYPSTYTKGDPIEGLKTIDCPVYHMGTSFDGVYRNAGGRVLCVTNFGSTLENARENVYKEITKLHAPQLFYRRDIGKRPGDKQ